MAAEVPYHHPGSILREAPPRPASSIANLHHPARSVLIGALASSVTAGLAALSHAARQTSHSRRSERDRRGCDDLSQRNKHAARDATLRGSAGSRQIKGPGPPHATGSSHPESHRGEPPLRLHQRAQMFNDSSFFH